MKKILILLICLINVCVCVASDHPEAHFGEYGIGKCSTLAEYQKYVGQKVKYMPTTPANYDDEKSGLAFDKIYTIDKITGNDRRMTFVLSDESGKKAKMIVNNEYNYYSYGKYTFEITNKYSIPLFLFEKFEKEKSKYLNKIISNPKVKSTYKIIDARFQTFNKESEIYSTYPELCFIAENSLTGKTSIHKFTDSEESYFDEDLSGHRETTLIKVEKPINDKIRYGKSDIVTDKGITKYGYIDNFINIVIYGDGEKFNFILKNISDNTIKVIWNEAVFVDENGSTSKIMHVGTRYSDKDGDQPTSVIIKDASIDDIAVPTSKVRYSDLLKKWVIDTYYPTTDNKDVKLMLPIQIKDVINEYVFNFTINWKYNHPELIIK